jgi:hypothetical protein
MSKLKNAGDYDIMSVGIVKDREFIDISQIFYDISIYESIFDPSMTGIVSIVDSNDIRQNYNLIGGEEIIIQFSTAGNDNETTVRGIVYKYSPYEEANNNIAFNIYFYSHELDSSLRQYCLEGYEDTISNIVTKIFDKIKKEKELIVEDTLAVTNYVCTRLRPFDVITGFLNQAVSKNKTSGYMFFENKDSWNFVTLETLYQQSPVTEFFYKPETVFTNVDQRNSESFQAIQKIEVISEDSYYNRLTDGQKGTVDCYYDMLNKKYYNQTYSRSSEFSRRRSLGKTLLDTEEQETHYNFRIGNSYIEDQYSYKNKLAVLNSDTFVANISVFGDNNLTVGQCITVNLPPKISNSVSENMYSGKFLITGIKHLLNKKTYTQVITISKDTVEEL